SQQKTVAGQQSAEKQNGRTSQIEERMPTTDNRQNVKRAEIAAIVDKFLRNKIAETPTETTNADSQTEIQNPKSKIQNPTGSPVKTIIHELKTDGATNGAKSNSVDFVSEDDVKKAIENGEKIYITAKTIITPSARDLGEEKEVFAKV
nr:hypothetical protein [Acidobacteriota bacterium]